MAELDSTLQKILEVVLSIAFFAIIFFAYAFVEVLIRPRVFPEYTSVTLGGMAVIFLYYVLLPNAGLVGGLTLLFVLEDVHFAVRDALVGVVAASLAVVVLAVYGVLGVRRDGRGDREERRRRREQQQRETGLSVVAISEAPLPSYDQLERTASVSSEGSRSSSGGSRSEDLALKIELPPPYSEVMMVEEKAGGQKDTNSLQEES